MSVISSNIFIIVVVFIFFVRYVNVGRKLQPDYLALALEDVSSNWNVVNMVGKNWKTMWWNQDKQKI